MKIKKLLLITAICLGGSIKATEVIDFKSLSSEKVQRQVHERIATLESLNTSLERERDQLKAKVKRLEDAKCDLLGELKTLKESLQRSEEHIKLLTQSADESSTIGVLKSQNEILTSHLRKLIPFVPRAEIDEVDLIFYRKLGIL